jgi:hypothetical protein
MEGSAFRRRRVCAGGREARMFVRDEECPDSWEVQQDVEEERVVKAW